MTQPDLSISSYIILGMIANYGPLTAYDLNQIAEGSISYFWNFSRSQLYAEPRRLSEEGYLEARQEADGRRRRVFSLTEAGHAALREWLADDETLPHENRDQGVLKLFFAFQSDPDTIRAQAERQIDVHRQRLAEYHQIIQERKERQSPVTPFELRTLRYGVQSEELAIAFWQDIAAQPAAMHEAARAYTQSSFADQPARRNDGTIKSWMVGKDCGE